MHERDWSKLASRGIYNKMPTARVQLTVENIIIIIIIRIVHEVHNKKLANMTCP